MPLTNNRTTIVLLIVFGWTALAFVAYISSLAPYWIEGAEKIPWRVKGIYASHWLLWIGLSFVAILLAKRFPISGSRLKLHIFSHLCFGILISVLDDTLAYLVNIPLRAYFELKPIPFSNTAAWMGYHLPSNLMVYGTIIGAAHAYDYYVKFRKSEFLSSQLEAKLAQSELQSLKMQLHPHFLFNTHHSIISLMLKERNEEAIKMLTQLSDLLRTTLEKTSQQLSSLREELDTLDLYLGIQKVRFKDRLGITVEAPEAVQEAEVPYLILQPIVENALQHGIDSLTTGGKLEILAKKEGWKLELIVSDNGPGYGNGIPPTNGNGIGLKTTRARLEQLYGNDQSLKIETLSEGGTRVTITIPFRKQDTSKSK